MSQHIHAIYEDGVLKPLEPLNLAEHQRVWVSVAPAGNDADDAADIVAQQRKAMQELDIEMDALPDNCPNDGFTAADHDKLLYGEST